MLFLMEVQSNIDIKNKYKTLQLFKKKNIKTTHAVLSVRVSILIATLRSSALILCWLCMWDANQDMTSRGWHHIIWAEPLTAKEELWATFDSQTYVFIWITTKALVTGHYVIAVYINEE